MKEDKAATEAQHTNAERKKRKFEEMKSLLGKLLPKPAKRPRPPRFARQNSSFLSVCLHCYETNQIANRTSFVRFPSITTKCGACHRTFEAPNPEFVPTSGGHQRVTPFPPNTPSEPDFSCLAEVPRVFSSLLPEFITPPSETKIA